MQKFTNSIYRDAWLVEVAATFPLPGFGGPKQEQQASRWVLMTWEKLAAVSDRAMTSLSQHPSQCPPLSHCSVESCRQLGNRTRQGGRLTNKELKHADANTGAGGNP